MTGREQRRPFPRLTAGAAAKAQPAQENAGQRQPSRRLGGGRQIAEISRQVLKLRVTRRIVVEIQLIQRNQSRRYGVLSIGQARVTEGVIDESRGLGITHSDRY